MKEQATIGRRVARELPGESMDMAIARRDVAGLQHAMAEGERAMEETGDRVGVFTDGMALLLVRGGVDAFIDAAGSPLVDPWTAYRVINFRARGLTGEQLGRLVAAVGAPPRGRNRTRLLREAIVGHPDAAVTRGLLAFIEAHAKEVADSPASSPRSGLEAADAVAALGERVGAEVPEALITLAKEMPWGEDTYTTAALLEGLLRHPDESCRHALNEIMAVHCEPNSVRLMLLAAEHTFSAEGATLRLLKDMRMPLGLAEHWEYLQLLRTWVLPQRESGVSISAKLLDAMRELSPEEWPAMLRVMYGLVLREVAPEHVGLARLTAWDRMRGRMIAGFEKLRLDSGWHAWVLPMLFASAVFISAGLNILLERPAVVLRGLNGTLIFTWMFVMVITSRTRFTEHERPGQKWWRALLFWGITGMMVASVLGTRIYARLGG